MFDSPPTSCIYPATRNLNDNPDLAKMEQKLEFLNRTQTSLNFGIFIQWQQMNNFLFTCIYLFRLANNYNKLQYEPLVVLVTVLNRDFF